MAFGGENAESYHDEGLTAMMKGDLGHAVQYFNRAIQLDRSYLAAFHQLGRCYLRMGQSRRAVEILGQVVARKPDLVPARLDLGYAWLAVGNPEEARQQFMQIVSRQPESARGHLGLAQVAFQQGEWSSAVTLAQAARAYGGATFATLFLLGRAAQLAGNSVLAEDSLREAEALIEKSVGLSPDTPEAHYLRGEVCFALGRYSAALDHYRAAEDRAAPHKYYAAFGENFAQVDVLVKRALCLQRLGHIEGARELGRQIVELAPDHKLGQALKDL
jgi:tetratricopeptide (TPR) repeat protein